MAEPKLWRRGPNKGYQTLRARRMAYSRMAQFVSIQKLTTGRSAISRSFTSSSRLAASWVQTSSNMAEFAYAIGFGRA